MLAEYSKICRVCTNPGSRNIFHNSLKLLEKLRYVAMIKIIENDDLPKSLCDKCIIDLNVAYEFKRSAVENDTKLRRYYIENGLNSSNLSAIGSENTGANHSNLILQGSIKPSNKTSFDENIHSTISSANSSKEIVPPIFIKTEEGGSFNYLPSTSLNSNTIRVKDFAHLKKDSMVSINKHIFNNLGRHNEADILENNLNSNRTNYITNGPSTSALPNPNGIMQSNLTATLKRSPRNKNKNIEGRLRKQGPREIRNLNIDLNWDYLALTKNKRPQRSINKVINVNDKQKRNVRLRAQQSSFNNNNNNNNEGLEILEQKVDIELLNEMNCQDNEEAYNNVLDNAQNNLLVPKTELGSSISKRSKYARQNK